MGYLSALDMAQTAETDDQVRRAIAWHLRHNHYPPVPISMVGACREAIQAVQDGEPERLIDLPDDVTHQGVGCTSAYVIVEGFHLDAFVVATLGMDDDFAG